MFNNDEKYIRKAFGKKNPFSVPEGYFDSLTPRIMQGIKQTDAEGKVPIMRGHAARTVSLWQRSRKFVIGVAASVCVGLFSLGAYFHSGNSQRHSAQTMQQAKAERHSDYSSIDEMVDYSMMDTEDMYAYMADLN